MYAIRSYYVGDDVLLRRGLSHRRQVRRGDRRIDAAGQRQAAMVAGEVEAELGAVQRFGEVAQCHPELAVIVRLAAAVGIAVDHRVEAQRHRGVGGVEVVLVVERQRYADAVAAFGAEVVAGEVGTAGIDRGGLPLQLVEPLDAP